MRRRLLVALVALAGVAASRPAPLAAQALMIAPNAVVIEPTTRSGMVTLVNHGDQPAEVSVTTQYGYPVTDSVGGMHLRTFDVVDDTMPSAAGWVRSFPERLVVAPGSRRVVRVLVTPPADLPDGEYWARLVVTSRAAQGAAPAVAVEGAEGVRIGLALELRSMLGLFYRHGRVATGVALDEAGAAVAGDSVVARVRMARQGNAAFVGSLRATLRDEGGAVRATALLPLGVYYDVAPRIAVPVAGLPAGRYALTLEAVSERPDVTPGLLLPISPARAVVGVTLPATAAAPAP